MNVISAQAKIDIRPLSAGLQKIAEQELNEVPERLAQDICDLRQWAQKQPHIRACLTDQFLVGFLRGSKFSLEKAKKKLDRYYALRVAIPEVFNELRQVHFPLTFEILRAGIILQLPLDLTLCEPCITIIRAGCYDTNKFKFADIVRVGTMFGEIMLLEDDNAAICGYKEIMDMRNVSSAHFFQLKPDILRKCAIYSDEAMPMRHRGIHFINVPPPFETGFNALKTIFPAKMMKRITVNSEVEDVFKFVPRQYLPTDYGGENASLKDIINQMELRLLRYSDYFLEERYCGSDEKLCQDKPLHCDPAYGTQGSFRKLEID